jgi:hypothetical protein
MQDVQRGIDPVARLQAEKTKHKKEPNVKDLLDEPVPSVDKAIDIRYQ